jgi:DNA polymerase-4
VTLKIRFADFSTFTRAHSGEPTQDGLRIYQEACRLLDRVRLDQPVRLIGLSVSGLGAAGQGQLPLFGPDAARQERLGRALDRLAERFGGDAVHPASLLGRRRSRPPAGEAEGTPPRA